METNLKSDERVFLVTGATGRIGSHIVKQLLELGHRVRVLTRNPSSTQFPAEVEVVSGDLTKPVTFASALDGVYAMHLIAFDKSQGGKALRTGGELMELAKQSSVKRVTVLTGTEEELEFARSIEESGLEWVHVRPPAMFMSNALHWASPIKNNETVKIAFPDVPDAVVHEADVAAVIVSAMTRDKHLSVTYEPTGPEALTRKGMIDQIAKTLGRDITISVPTNDEYRDIIVGYGVTMEVADFVVKYEQNPPEKAYTVVPVVENVTGKMPRKFRDWVKNHIELFRISE